MTVPADWMQPAFHPTYARVLCMMLRKRGVDVSCLLDGTGLNWPQLLNAERGLSFAQLRSLILAALRQSVSPLLGMELGAALPVSAHGQVGYAAMASKTLEQAFEVISRYSRLRSNAFEWRLSGARGQCAVRIQECIDLHDVRIPILEAVSTMQLKVIEALLGYAPENMELRLPYRRPLWHAEYTPRFAVRIVFDADCLELRFPENLLAAPCLSADPGAYAAARRDCEQGLAQLALEGDLLQQISARLRACEERYPGCDEMATQFHMSARTLMRRLKERGTSYQELLDEARKERAQWFLLHTGDSVEIVAERLGYLDTSNFSRTFRRWFGMSPKEFRNAARSLPPTPET